VSASGDLRAKSFKKQSGIIYLVSGGGLVVVVLTENIGSYRLGRLLTQLDGMACAPISPRSPGMSTALNAPLDFLPVTRFPQMDERLDGIHENTLETQKERQVIQSQVRQNATQVITQVWSGYSPVTPI